MDVDDSISNYPDGVMSDIYYKYFYNEEKINELFEDLKTKMTF